MTNKRTEHFEIWDINTHEPLKVNDMDSLTATKLSFDERHEADVAFEKLSAKKQKQYTVVTVNSPAE